MNGNDEMIFKDRFKCLNWWTLAQNQPVRCFVYQFLFQAFLKHQRPQHVADSRDRFISTCIRSDVRLSMVSIQKAW